MLTKDKRKLKTLEKIHKGFYLEDIDLSQYKGTDFKVMNTINELKSQLLIKLFEIQVVSSQIDQSTAKMENTLSKQTQNAHQIKINSDDLYTINEKNREAICTAHESTNALSDVMEENIESIMQLQESNEKTQKDISHQLNEIAVIIEIISIVNESSMKFDSSIQHLFQTLQSVLSSLEIIKQFHKKTQLLSLNASIEAARAGEYGRGFRIVANEIKELATSSSQAVDDIQELIQTIQTEIKEVDGKNSSNMQHIKNAVGHTVNMNKGLKAIENSYEVFNKGIDNVACTIQKNKTIIHNIDTVMENVLLASNTITETIENINSNVDKQYKQSKTLTDLKSTINDTADSLQSVADFNKMNLLKQNNKSINKQILDITTLLNEIIDKYQLANEGVFNYEDILNEVLQDRPDIEAIWVNALDGSFIYSYPPAGISNASIREWFKESCKGNVYVSDTYISAISKSPCVTIALPIMRQKEVVGVLGVDIYIKFGLSAPSSK